jgi:type II secretory pathway predicted ATPase ExeA
VRRIPDLHDLLIITDESKRLLTEHQKAGHETSLSRAIIGQPSNPARPRLSRALVLLRRLFD